MISMVKLKVWPIIWQFPVADLSLSSDQYYTTHPTYAFNLLYIVCSQFTMFTYILPIVLKVMLW